MGKFAVGDVVMVIFPCSDLSSAKKRPALVVGLAEFGNYILCQITSKSSSSQRAIALTPTDFDTGKLPVVSYVRPDKLSTLDPSLIQDQVGTLLNKKMNSIKAAIQALF